MKLKKSPAHYAILLSLVILLISEMAMPSEAKAYTPSSVLAYETSFENGGESEWITAATGFTSGEHHSYSKSLAYTRTSAGTYIYPSKILPGQGGERFYATVWIKTSGLSGPGGATLALEALDSSGNWVGGQYLPGVASAGWTQLRLPIYTLPANTAKISVSLYLEQGTTGQAWFDDLQVFEVQSAPLFYAYLDYPSYRGKLISGDHTDIRVKTVPHSWSADFSGYTTKVSLYDSSNVLLNSASYTGQQATATLFAGSGLAAGSYKLVVQLIRTSTGQVKGYIEKPIAKTGSTPADYVDKYGRLWRSGSLFFPIGIYTADITAADLADLSGSAFNTILAYGHPDLTKLNLADSYGMKVIYSFKDFYYGSPYAPSFITSEADEAPQIAQHVNWFKSHPALLAWYLNDEAPNDPRLPAHYEAVVANDPDHPAYIVDYNTPNPDQVLRSTDIFGMDRYVVKGLSGDPIAEPGAYQKAAKENLWFRGQWPVVQAHNLANYGQGGTRPPTLQEVRNMAWQYLTEGATGLMFYSLFDLKSDASGVPYATLLNRVKQVASEVESFVPILLSVDATPTATTTGGSWLNWMVKQYGGDTYIFAVNNGKSNRTASFTVPGATSVQAVNESRSLALTGGTFTDSFSSLGIHIYKVER
ncbi:hypothetical protein [Cohnella phaseoli]|uniref:Uncharacterized protein n=1 Tax=Cohnella phaseoli TaxID=456490 RepID=A0A3D9KI26_9BACL|nr:hypothetical protein [Cohnella phaseoli]RED85534.1 hypothetical protein DFP98_104239 [Cohnella phaseoli]